MTILNFEDNMVGMPNFEGDTFVAFIDISGFKNLIKQNKAQDKLNIFFNEGARVIRKYEDLNGILASDSCILFINIEDYSTLNLTDQIRILVSLLDAIKEINETMLRTRVMLTTSVAYGHFRYEDRIELARMRKNLFYGNAYVDAFIDNEYGERKIRPGECRIVGKKLPPTLKSYLDMNNKEYVGDPLFKNTLELLKKDRRHYYFYWMIRNLGDSSEITSFKRNYTKAYNSRYENIRNLLKKEAGC